MWLVPQLVRGEHLLVVHAIWLVLLLLGLSASSMSSFFSSLGTMSDNFPFSQADMIVF